MKTLYTLLACLVIFSHSAVAEISGPAPGFELNGADGPVNLADYHGKVVYLDFWASWCSPCKDSFPWMNRMQEKYRKDGVVFIAINVDREKQKAVGFLENNHAGFTVAFDPKGKTPAQYGLMGMPTAFVIDRDGNILHHHIGFNSSDAQSYEQHIQNAL